jgi:hypothetical protein
MWRFFLALLVLAGAGAGAWWLVNDSPSFAQAAEPAREDALTPLPARAADLSLAADAATPGSGSAAADASARNATPPTPAPPEPQGLEDGGEAPAPNLDFGWKYGGWSEGEMTQRLATLEGELQLALDREFRPRLEQGRYDERAIGADDKRSVAEVLAEHGADDPLCRVWPVFDPSGASSPTAEQRLIAVRILCLSRAEFAHLAELADERSWLRGRLASDKR